MQACSLAGEQGAGGQVVIGEEDRVRARVVVHQGFHRLFAGLEWRPIRVRDEDPRPDTELFHGCGIAVATLQCAEVGRDAVLHEGNAPVTFVMQITGCHHADVIVRKADLDRAAVGLVVPGFDHRDIGLLDHFLGS